MALRLYNTLTRQKDLFESLEPGQVRMYTCGPTVYNHATIGNFRAFVAQDLLKRHLIYRGYKVSHVMNLTDVEDKIIRACRETGETLKSLTGKYIQAFLEDLHALDIIPPSEMPAATDHVDDMVAFVKRLRENGHTYEASGSIYFKLDTFPDYGRLSRFDMEQLRAGASGRVDVDEYTRDNVRDFALWKAYVEEDGDVFWETDLGKGRPGWHLECSVMSMKYLGETFDIHCGGVDLIFPHHENEIAQSVAATGKPFVRHWFHNAHLVVEGRKMSKSSGNFYTLRDLTRQGHDPLAVRWVLLATHYRQPNNFTFEALEAARQSLHRIRDFRIRLSEVSGSNGSGLEEERTTTREAFADAMDDDLNISAALGVAFGFIRDTNKLIDEDRLSAEGAQGAQELLDEFHRITGLFSPVAAQAPEAVLARVLERQQARRDKDFAKADTIRDELAGAGWLVEDTSDGPRVKPI